ncbi:SUMF1/EgtB/PvdO family nonheme iron enzyme, partial [Salmonella enterica]|uniref:SUMF1/EgtB/PvdO family nonheme iron enzyme n=1 Tax=Salmonella enterica TaxID=28901 RepID=UPI0010F7E8FF
MLNRVSEFEVTKFQITNEEFLEFLLANGYEKRQYWTDESWEMVQFKQAKHPLWWRCPKACQNGCGTSLASISHCRQNSFSDT